MAKSHISTAYYARHRKAQLTNIGEPASLEPKSFSATVGIRPRYAICPDHTGSIIDRNREESSTFLRTQASSARLLNIDRLTADRIPSLPTSTSHVAELPSRKCRTVGAHRSGVSAYEMRRFEKWIGMLGSRCLARSCCSTDL